ncbi:DUF2905 domain-containing protein [Balneolaceae bacterium ANBcel3]|nr:DUF2905 domain-containing protein [Balneolaceae bacterium ANBcel3]
MGRLLILTGILFIMTGIVLKMFPGLAQFLGRLPGDLTWESGNKTVHFPVTTMIIISLLLTILLNYIRKFL